MTRSGSVTQPFDGDWISHSYCTVHAGSQQQCLSTHRQPSRPRAPTWRHPMAHTPCPQWRPMEAMTHPMPSMPLHGMTWHPSNGELIPYMRSFMYHVCVHAINGDDLANAHSPSCKTSQRHACRLAGSPRALYILVRDALAISLTPEILQTGSVLRKLRTVKCAQVCRSAKV